jgi:hypothetical protein
LDEVIEKIRQLILKSAETTSSGKLNIREIEVAKTTEQWSKWTAPKSCLGSRWISIARVESS